MNTPTHLAISHAILGNQKKLTNNEQWSIFLGAFLPDAAIFVLFFWAVLNGYSQATIWDELYFTPFWTNLVDYFNSIPITLVLIAIGAFKKWRWLRLYGASSMLHIVVDFFTHSSDAHQHFLPLTTWTFNSPVSYWEPDRFGAWVAAIEVIIFAISAYYIHQRLKPSRLKKIITLLFVVWILISIAAPIILIFFNPFN